MEQSRTISQWLELNRKLKVKSMNKIDFVFPYVDCNDPVWQEVYKEERRKNNLPTAVSKVRFREWENLKYLFRGIEKFAPWIGNVYMIVSNKEQVPSWVNTDEVKIVLHSDIIPEEFLPTFNSTTIEMFLGNIKGLSERFIYSNDDMFIIRDMKEEDFFINSIPKLSVKKDHGQDTMFKKVEWNCLKIVADYFKKKIPSPEDEFLKLPHTMVPMSTESVRIVEKIFKPEIYNSCSSFRKAKNFNQYIYTYYQLFSGSYLEGKRTYKYTSFREGKDWILDKAKKIADDIIYQRYDTICINDVSDFNEVIFKAVKTTINSAFEKILPDVSKYELNVEDIKEKKYNIFKWLNKIGATFNFESDDEIKMFVEGIMETIDKIFKSRETEEVSSNDDLSSLQPELPFEETSNNSNDNEQS